MPRLLVWVFCLLPVAGPAIAVRSEQASQALAHLPHAEMVVKQRAYVSLNPVPRGSMFEVAVVAEILPGFHINANKVLQSYLIPTMLEAELPAGFRLIETIYPRGHLKKFDFSEEKIAVYDGTVTLRMKIEARQQAPLGAVRLPLALRYQACNDTTCLPPVKIPVPVEMEIAPTGAKARPTHPNIFRHAEARKD
jgi:hypothetical protein